MKKKARAKKAKVKRAEVAPVLPPVPVVFNDHVEKPRGRFAAFKAFWR